MQPWAKTATDSLTPSAVSGFIYNVNCGCVHGHWPVSIEAVGHKAGIHYDCQSSGYIDF